MGWLDKLLRLLFGDPEPPVRSPSSVENRDLASMPQVETETTGKNRRGHVSLSGLDNERFAPLTMKEALGESLTPEWTSAYFDSLSVIPPEDLPRIRVIDGTMVGLGLISREELAEIHEVGRRMDEYRNVGAVIQRAGDEAVGQARQARARLKEQKKIEAADRKAARERAVAKRKATDIVYLGRGVSRGLADRRANVEKLEANGLPVIASPAELAEILTIPIPKLRWLAFHSEAPSQVHYVSFDVPKRSGGVRRLSTPHRQLAAVQRWILEKVLGPIPTHDAAHGFVPSRSTLTNARPHVEADVVVNADLCDFFPTITFYRVEGMFRSVGYSPAVATILALLCTECPREAVKFGGQLYYPATGPRALPQGACTSPAISNLVTRNLDHRLTGIAARLGWTYTRYADDLTFSGRGEFGGMIGYLLARIRHIVQDEGFRVNERKTRVLRRGTRQLVTGIVVNDKPSVPRPVIRRLRAILHQARRTGLAAQNRDDIPHFKAWLRGMIAYVEMVNPSKGRELRGQYERLRS